jgi:cell division transport system permease protein
MNSEVAQPSKPELHSRLVAWVVSHARAFFFSLGKLYRTPLASFMTMAVIGIALALPSGLYLLLKNMEQAAGGWDNGARISLFLKQGTNSKEQKALADKIQERKQIERITLITPEQALKEFKQTSGFGEALDALDANPLPPVLVLYPAPGLADHPKAVEVMLENLRRIDGVDEAILDMRWLQRLQAILATAKRTVTVISGMLALAVILVVGNTIRLDIQNRRQEIEVAKLIGATDAFIRRPFLYGGIWYGLFGAFLGIILIEASLGLLQSPVQKLAGLYESDYSLVGLNSANALWILGTGILLGWLGSWIAVGRHIRDIEPS